VTAVSRAERRRGAADPPSPVTSAGSFWLGLLLPVAVAFLVFAGALGHGFIWDDPLVLEQLRAIRGAGDLFVPPDVIPKFYYRPFVFLTFLVDRGVGGETPFWFHLTVILWHAATTGLVFLLARSLLGEDRIVESAIAAVLFAVHPVHVESVAWIAGRSDVMATTLLIAALLAFGAKNGWGMWIGAAFFLFALLAKEVAVAGLFLIPARDLLVERRPLWSRYAPLVVVLALYLALRRLGLGGVATGTPTGEAIANVVLSLLAGIGWYAAMLVAPLHLNAYVPRVPVTPFHVAAGSAAIAIAAAVAIAGLRERRAVATFLCLWLVATMAPSLLVILRRSASAVLAERYLYLPSVAFVILVGYGLVLLGRRSLGARNAALAILAVMALAGAWGSTVRSRVWADDLVFWRDVAAKSSDDAMAHRELASALMRRDLLDEARVEFEAALALESSREDRVMTYNNLGNLHLRRNELDAAERSFQAGLALYPHHYLLSGLGRLAMKRAEQAQARGDQPEVVRQVRAARDFFERALAADPNDYRNRVLLGQVLFSLGERDAARAHFEAALRIEPNGRIADTAREFLRRMGASN
jgi:hypothetical protein